MHNEGARFPVDKDALAASCLAQEQRKGMARDHHAQPINTQGNQSVPGESRRLSAAQIAVTTT